MGIAERVQILRMVILFSYLSTDVLEDIAKKSKEVSYSSNKEIFKEGATANGLYIVCKGAVKIEKGGQELITYGPGKFFGELALLNNAPRAASAITKEDSTLLLLDKDTFDDLTDEFPDILKIVVKTALGYLEHKKINQFG